jgi:hypothetical protein
METLPLTQTSLLVVDAQRGFTTLCPDELPIPETSFEQSLIRII